MIALKKILFPTDFSEPSDYALNYALSLAMEYGATLVLLHVIEEFHYSTYYEDLNAPSERIYAEVLKEAEERMGQVVSAEEREKLKAASGEVEQVIRKGEPFSEVIQAAREEEIDLIVMGTHGKTGLSHALMGSTAERVVRLAPCPVLTIRSPEYKFVMP